MNIGCSLILPEDFAIDYHFEWSYAFRDLDQWKELQLTEI